MEWIQLFPLWYQYLMVTVFGVIIGSFLNVYIYRFHTGKSLSGNSHCLSCGEHLRWFELFPLLSYLCLRGRCRTCGCAIPVRYFLVELLTALLFLEVFITASSLVACVVGWFVMSLLVIITVYDIRHFIIPDALTVCLTGVLLALLGYDWLQGAPLESGIHDVSAALAGTGFFFLLWFVSKGRWIGFGDVKLAFPLGLLVGASGVFSMVVLSFWIGAAVSLLLIGLARLERGKLSLRFTGLKLTIKSVVPFAPFMIAGCLAVFFTHFDVLSLFTF